MFKHPSDSVDQEKSKVLDQAGSSTGIKHVNSSDDVSDNLIRRKSSFEYQPSAITTEAKRSYRFFSTDDQGNKIEVFENPHSIMETSNDSDSDDSLELTGLDSPVKKKDTEF
jgi:hypothetical protein